MAHLNGIKLQGGDTPQWSRAEYRPDDRGNAGEHEPRVGAAMEPAEDRPDGVSYRPWRMASAMPQWSRPEPAG
jgi:hypothetical protein